MVCVCARALGCPARLKALFCGIAVLWYPVPACTSHAVIHVHPSLLCVVGRLYWGSPTLPPDAVAEALCPGLQVLFEAMVLPGPGPCCMWACVHLPAACASVRGCDGGGRGGKWTGQDNLGGGAVNHAGVCQDVVVCPCGRFCCATRSPTFELTTCRQHPCLHPLVWPGYWRWTWRRCFFTELWGALRSPPASWDPPPSWGPCSRAGGIRGLQGMF